MLGGALSLTSKKKSKTTGKSSSDRATRDASMNLAIDTNNNKKNSRSSPLSPAASPSPSPSSLPKVRRFDSQRKRANKKRKTVTFYKAPSDAQAWYTCGASDRNKAGVYHGTGFLSAEYGGRLRGCTDIQNYETPSFAESLRDMQPEMQWRNPPEDAEGALPLVLLNDEHHGAASLTKDKQSFLFKLLKWQRDFGSKKTHRKKKDATKAPKSTLILGKKSTLSSHVATTFPFTMALNTSMHQGGSATAAAGSVVPADMAPPFAPAPASVAVVPTAAAAAPPPPPLTVAAAAPLPPKNNLLISSLRSHDKMALCKLNEVFENRWQTTELMEKGLRLFQTM